MIETIATSHTSAAIMDDANNQGCPLCQRRVVDPKRDTGTFLYDARGRYWCLTCAGRALAEITRKGETRTTAHYRWEIDANLTEEEKAAMTGMVMWMNPVAAGAVKRWLGSKAAQPFDNPTAVDGDLTV